MKKWCETDHQRQSTIRRLMIWFWYLHLMQVKTVECMLHMHTCKWLSLLWFPDLITLQGKSFGDTIDILYNNKEARVFTDFISFALKKEMIKDIMKLGYFSVLSDSSTDSSTQEEIIVYLSTSMITALLMSVALNAQMYIHSYNIHFRVWFGDFREKKVPGCLNGANMEYKTGVAALLRRDVPNITIHCCSHRLELAVKDIINSIVYRDFINTLFNDL